MRRRVQSNSAYKKIFTELKLRLTGIQSWQGPEWNDFKLHLYLTDGLGRAAECLVEVSLTTSMCLSISALVVCLLSHYYQVAFMYFLPGLTVLGFLFFLISHFVSRYFRRLLGKDDHNAPAKYVTIHSFCRSIQIMLYCIFYSFSRLLLSNDTFTFYPMVYIMALASLVIVLVLLGAFAGQVIKETVCALILPPHITEEQLRQNLQHVVYWYTYANCAHCGVQQPPFHKSSSYEWVGRTMASGQTTPREPESPFQMTGLPWEPQPPLEYASLHRERCWSF